MINFFIRRPIFAMVISIIIVILGVISIESLPVEQYPDISPPNVQVSASYQGADAMTVDEAVATPIGQSIMGVGDMLYMQTTSSSDGHMSLTATFAVGSTPDMNAIFTQNKIESAIPMLPSVVKQQGVTTNKSMSGFLMVFALYSDGRYDNEFLSNYAYINIQNELLKIDGVGEVKVMGAGKYSMRIWIKPDVLSYLNVSLEDIISAVEAQSGVFPAGKLGGEPSGKGIEFTYTVTMPLEINSAEEYENIIIRTLPNGGQIKLGDIARVELGSQIYGVNSSFDKHPATMITVSQVSGSNAMEVGATVKDKMKELSRDFDDGINYRTMVDITQTIESAIDDIIQTLLIALILVMLIIYLFMQDVRAMVIPLVAIPVSLIGAFMLFPILGFTVNIFSMLGLILAIGLVVDDAIVVVEAVQVNVSAGMNLKQATREAMKSVAPPIIATTVVLAAVFIPVSFIGGITGQLYQQFAITIALSVVISAFNALTLSPALCSIVLRDKKRATKGFFGAFNRWFDRRVEGFVGVTKVIAKHGTKVLIFIAILCGVIIGLSQVIPSGFLPQEDNGYLMIGVNLPNASSLERTQEVVDEIEQMVSKMPEVEYVGSVSGFNMLSNVVSSNSALLFVTLVDYDDRKVTAMELVDKLNGEMYVMINKAQVFAFQTSSIPGLGATSGISLMVQDRAGNTINYLAEHTDAFIEKARRLPEISSVITQFDAEVPQRKVEIDKNRAFQQGVSLNDIHSTLATYLGGAYINNFNRFGQIYQTYIQSEAQYRESKDDLASYFVKNANSESIPLASFVSISDTTGVEFINQFNLYRSIGVNANASHGYSSTQAMDALQGLADSILPKDMTIAWSGMSFQEQNAAGNGVMAFVIAILFVFLILAALYDSWILPWSILLGVPFALFGAMIFIFCAHYFNPAYVNNIFMQISLILLIGLSAKNAILIVEYANDLFFGQGKDIVESAIGAAKLRFRPIIMTAMAFLLGVSPLILSSGASSVAQTVMGVALVGGMGVATLIGVFVYPALYVFIAKIGQFEKIRERRFNDLKDENSTK